MGQPRASHGPHPGDPTCAPGDGGADVVVVLNYRRAGDTLACVESLLAGPSSPTILVVDNGSGDGVLDTVAARWPQVRTLQTGANLGFAGGMNAGLRAALAAGAGTVTVLNNDTLVPPGAIARLAGLARRGLAVAPVIVHADDPARPWFEDARIDPEMPIPVHCSPIHEIGCPADPAVRLVPALTGCALTASTATWGAVGLFDERYFLIFEDSDWSARAAAAGIPLGVDTTTTIRHAVSASFTGAAASLATFYYTRNGLRYLRERQAAPPRARLAFLRRYAGAGLRAQAGSEGVAAAARRAVLVGWGVGAALLGQHGPAPRWLAARVARWTHPPTPG